MIRLGLIALIVAGCGGSSAPVVERPEGVEPDEAVREARDLIEEAYASLRRGDAEGLLPLLADDVFIVGPGASHVLPTGSDALVAFGDFLDDAKVKKHKLKSRDLQVVASSGGHSAWATDHVELDGATYALTAVLVHDDDLWTFRAIHVSQTWKPKQLAKRELEDGRPFPALAGAAPPAQRQLLDLAEAAITDLQARLDQLPDVEADAGFDAIVLGAAPRGATHGVKKITKAWKKALKKQPPDTDPEGAAGFGVTDDDAIAWVCANVVTDDDPPFPHRLFLLYVRDDDAWRLMAIHDAMITASQK